MVDDSVERITTHYPQADITPAEFEEFVLDLLKASSPLVEKLHFTLHDKISAFDGTYDFDASVRFEFGGMSFLVLVEAKKHKNPIKRELVQVLHQKVQSVGGHKGVLISTAPFQAGALKYAQAHGIALVTVTEGRFTVEHKSYIPPPPPSRAEATEMGIPVYVGHVYGADEPGSTSVTLISTEYPEYILEDLFGVGQD